MKYLLPIALLFIGCSENEPTPVRDAFVKKYGTDHIFYCNEAGFLIEEFAWGGNADRISIDLVKNDAGIPIRCNVENTSIIVKETAATGSISGSVQ